jgi:hypothetical protein
VGSTRASDTADPTRIAGGELLVQDAQVRVADLGARLDPELVSEPSAQVDEQPQRGRLLPATGEASMRRACRPSCSGSW